MSNSVTSYKLFKWLLWIRCILKRVQLKNTLSRAIIWVISTKHYQTMHYFFEMRFKNWFWMLNMMQSLMKLFADILHYILWSSLTLLMMTHVDTIIVVFVQFFTRFLLVDWPGPMCNVYFFNHFLCYHYLHKSKIMRSNIPGLTGRTNL